MHRAITDAFSSALQGDASCEAVLARISRAYSAPERRYHNLRHLDQLVRELEPLHGEIADWNLLMLAAAYHDIIYDTARSDNEEASAARAVVEMTPFLEPTRLQKLQAAILATKYHVRSEDAAVNLFCDADLSILGAAPEVYDSYARQIREEYNRYPDARYNPGRAAVLRQLLEQPALFKSEYFQTQYEAAARKNILRELESLRRRMQRDV